MHVPGIRHAATVADAIPGAEFAVISPGGHLHNIDGAPEFNRVTLDFLMRHP